MNLLLHQLKTDLFRQRWLFLGLALLLIGVFFDWFPSEWLFLAGWAILLLELMQSERVMTSQGFWQTRPFGRFQFLLAKLALVFLSFLLLHTVVALADWWRYNLQWHQAFRGSVRLAFLTGGVYAFLAVGAALSKSRRDFFLFITIGFLVVIGMMIAMMILISQRDRIQSPWINPMIGLNLVGLVTAGVCWWLGPARRQERLAFGVWCLGLALAIPAAMLWPWQTFAPHKLTMVAVPMRLLESETVLETGEEMWFQRFLVRPGEGLQARLVSTYYRHQDLPSTNTNMRSYESANYRDRGADVRTLKARYPQETRWMDMERGHHGHLGSLEPGNRLEGTLQMEVFRWVPTKISAPTVGQRGASSQGGNFRILRQQEHNQRMQLSIRRCQPGRIRTNGPGPQNFSSNNFPEIVYVLYHPALEMAIRSPNVNGQGHSTPTLAFVTNHHIDFAIPYAELTLLGISVEQWLTEARLDIYERQVVGQAKVAFRDEVAPPEFDVRSRPPEPRTAPAIRSTQEEALSNRLISVVRERLQNRVPLPGKLAGDALQMVAHEATAADAEDLHWHFIHARGGQSQATKAFENAPALDAKQAVLGAWRRSSFGLLTRQVHDRIALAPHAARYGDREALRQTVAMVTNADRKAWPDEQVAAALRELRRVIPYEETDEAFTEWILEHWETLVWDASRTEWNPPPP